MMSEGTIFSDFLSALGVPHTADYSNEQFRNMPFKSLFGFTKLLRQYGIDSEGYKLGDNSEISAITPPFLARSAGGFVIVTGMTDSTITYLTQGVEESMPLADFINAWCGTVLLAYPNQDSAEPEYKLHKREEFFAKSKKWVLYACAIALFGYLIISNGIYRNLWQILLVIVDLTGLYLTYMLVQKSLKIKNAKADRVCGVLQAGGCDDILETSASKFFGLFGWSEVGFAYFSVSLLTLLIFPQYTGYLALCNACCLPFTAWSIWYQKFRAKIWCTLCVCVQCTLWLLFFCYLFGGFYKDIFPIRIEFFVLGASYVTALLGLNRVMPFFDQSKNASE